MDLMLESKSEEARSKLRVLQVDIELHLLDHNHLMMIQKGFVFKYFFTAGHDLLLMHLNALVCRLGLYCSPLLSFRDLILFAW